MKLMADNYEDDHLKSSSHSNQTNHKPSPDQVRSLSCKVIWQRRLIILNCMLFSLTCLQYLGTKIAFHSAVIKQKLMLLLCHLPWKLPKCEQIVPDANLLLSGWRRGGSKKCCLPKNARLESCVACSRFSNSWFAAWVCGVPRTVPCLQ